MRHVIDDARRAGRHLARALGANGPRVIQGIVVAPHRAVLRPHHRGLQQVAVDADVEQLRLRALIGLARCDLLRRDHAAYAALRIVEVARHDRLRRTYDHAGRFEAKLDTMRAEIAFGRGAGRRIDIQRVVRTRLHARFASDTSAVVEIDDPVVAAEERAGRTNLDARRAFAMIAAHHTEMPA